MDYSKGDWKGRGYDIILKGSGSRIAKMDTGWSNEKILANAHLIAAAPDMYEALKNLMHHPTSINYLMAAEQALAKAEGNPAGTCPEGK